VARLSRMGRIAWHLNDPACIYDPPQRSPVRPEPKALFRCPLMAEARCLRPVRSCCGRRCGPLAWEPPAPVQTEGPQAAGPADFPPWQTVYGYFAAWRDDGTLARLHEQIPPGAPGPVQVQDRLDDPPPGPDPRPAPPPGPVWGQVRGDHPPLSIAQVRPWRFCGSWNPRYLRNPGARRPAQRCGTHCVRRVGDRLFRLRSTRAMLFEALGEPHLDDRLPGDSEAPSLPVQ
jgi:hypothetical protein